ncbi:unnamed protein product [Gongylonema pulchrum]|uniref:Ovule protein n=1 Tax=Gongylonema pulchrum TaxID=637853 RepID=A0A183E818_9BILA|nr:unnamed protein product [Gongylonema pulchrum]
MDKLEDEKFAQSNKIEETSVSLKESRQNSSVTLQSQNEDEKRELTDQGNVLEEKTILEIAAKFEAEEELQPEHPDKNNILSTFGEKLDQSNEEAASPNPVTKVTASVAPLKQASESPVSFESEKFGKDDRMNKQAASDIFTLSAGEARSRLVNRKKDPRRDVQMSLQEKYQLVSNM